MQIQKTSAFQQTYVFIISPCLNISKSTLNVIYEPRDGSLIPSAIALSDHGEGNDCNGYVKYN